jgi:hypothetical protein
MSAADSFWTPLLLRLRETRVPPPLLLRSLPVEAALLFAGMANVGEVVAVMTGSGAGAAGVSSSAEEEVEEALSSSEGIVGSVEAVDVGGLVPVTLWSSLVEKELLVGMDLVGMDLVGKDSASGLVVESGSGSMKGPFRSTAVAMSGALEHSEWTEGQRRFLICPTLAFGGCTARNRR